VRKADQHGNVDDSDGGKEEGADDVEHGDPPKA
jgi:hypothetical protein